MADAGTTVDLRNRRIGPYAGERIRVLLVEDDPGDAFLVRELLAEASAPFDVQVAQVLTTSHLPGALRGPSEVVVRTLSSEADWSALTVLLPPQ